MLVYNVKEKTYKIIPKCIIENSLKIVVGYTYEKKDDILIYPILSMSFYDLQKELKNYEEYYAYFIFDDATLFYSYFLDFPSVKFVDFPNGTTCAKVLSKFKKYLPKNLDYFVVNDNGTKSLLPSIYYGLQVAHMLEFKTTKRIRYARNYDSISNAKFSRARYRLGYLDYYLERDFVITPCLQKQNQEELIEHLNQYTKKGYIIYGNYEKVKDLDYNVRVKVNKAMWLLKIHGKTKRTNDLEVKPGKTSNKQLIEILRSLYS